MEEKVRFLEQFSTGKKKEGKKGFVGKKANKSGFVPKVLRTREKGRKRGGKKKLGKKGKEGSKGNDSFFRWVTRREEKKKKGGKVEEKKKREAEFPAYPSSPFKGKEKKRGGRTGKEKD